MARTRTNAEIINTYDWNEEELKVLQTENIETLMQKVADLDEKVFQMVTETFTGWLLGENTRKKFRYWLKKSGLSEAELNIWCTI